MGSHHQATSSLYIMELIPAELLYQVFRALPRQELKIVVQVCQRWRQVCETPELWSWATVTIGKWNVSSIVESLAKRRLGGVSSIWLWEISPSLFEVLSLCPRLREVNVHADISWAPPELVAKMASRVEQLHLSALSGLSGPQALSILTAACTADSCLKAITFSTHPTLPSCNAFTHLPETLVTKTSECLYKVNLKSALSRNKGTFSVVK